MPMLSRTLIRTRPNANIAWFHLKSSVMDKKLEEYRKDQRIILHAFAETPDGLRIIAVTIWQSLEVMLEFHDDPVIRSVIDLRNRYEQRFGINTSLIDQDIYDLTQDESFNPDDHVTSDGTI